MDQHARIVIIGGGAMGCSLLYHLARLGWSDAVLVEKHELTAGSTWHAAGLCTHFAHNLTIMQLRAYSVRLYRDELAADSGQPVGFHGCGALRITRSPERMDEFRHVQALGRFGGQTFHLLTPSELRAIYPLVETDGLLGAFYEPNDGYVDPSQATHAMAAGARQRGARILRHCPVTGIERHAGHWRVTTPEGRIECEVLVNAAGTWAREIGLLMGVDLPIVPMLHQYLVTDDIADLAAIDHELPIIRDPEESWYVRQERAGLIIGPYEREGQPWAVDGVPPAFGMELLPPALERIEPILAAAITRLPALANAGIKRVINGPITFTPDAAPLIGPAPGLDQAWLLTGSSMGVMEGGGAGKFLAEWIVGGEPPMDALAIDPRRFGPWADRRYRLAKAVESFANQFGIHYPYEERPAGRPCRTASTYATLLEAGAQFGAVNGWERANWFATDAPTAGPAHSFRRAGWFRAVGEECLAVRDRVGICDMSQLAKFEVRGADAVRFVDTLGANRAPTRAGGIGLIHALTPSGGVRSEFTVVRLAADAFYLTGAAAAEQHDEQLLRAHGRSLALELTNRTEALGVLAVAGPLARTLLAGVTDTDLGNGAFPWLTARDVRIGEATVRALRVSYVGELGWELHCRREDQPLILQALRRAGERLGARLFGAFALNAMRIEKGYPAWGADLSTERTPLESGLERFVHLSGRRFTGAQALAGASGRPRPMRLRLLEVIGSDVDPYYGHPVLSGDSVVGLVSSGAWGHRVGKALALAYLDAAIAPQSTALTVQILERAYAARVLTAAAYDPAGERPRA